MSQTWSFSLDVTGTVSTGCRSIAACAVPKSRWLAASVSSMSAAKALTR
ncbi:hypothetical protein [Cryobacterium sp. 10C3]|nr:hypothetical protein [Cryobacterium sp. 10C3]MDY7555669.1 hypothetical protein [Cryobacterium sp. 10C3]